ncbi:MAG: DNA-binding response OmpR family regulator, partial [Candidatus Azotimanducaceae bacterium]
YGSDWTYGNRKIDVSVSSLRKKLKQINALAKIHTISGQGYLLSVYAA